MENTETIDKTSEIIGFLLKTLQDTSAFAKEQAPDVVKQMLAYEAWEAKLILFCGIIVLVIGLIALFFLVKNFIDEHASEGSIVISSVFMVAGLLFGTMITLGALSTLKKLEIAPKVYLLEQLSSITKSKCK